MYCGYKLILFFMVIWKTEDFIYFNKKFYFKIFKLFLSYELNKKTEKILKLSNDRNKRNKSVPKSHGWGFKHISLFWSFFKGRIFFVFLFSLYNKKSLRTNKYRNIYHETKHLNISGEQKKIKMITVFCMFCRQTFLLYGLNKTGKKILKLSKMAKNKECAWSTFLFLDQLKVWGFFCFSIQFIW